MSLQAFLGTAPFRGTSHRTALGAPRGLSRVCFGCVFYMPGSVGVDSALLRVALLDTDLLASLLSMLTVALLLNFSSCHPCVSVSVLAMRDELQAKKKSNGTAHLCNNFRQKQGQPREPLEREVHCVGGAPPQSWMSHLTLGNFSALPARLTSLLSDAKVASQFSVFSGSTPPCRNSRGACHA